MSNDTPEYNGIIWRKGRKTILRPVEEADLPDFQRWINNPTTNQNLLRTGPQSMVQMRRWFERINDPSQTGICVAVCTHDGALLGNMSLHWDCKSRSGTTGSLLGNTHYQGQGYGTDAKMQLLEYAFNWLGLRRVTSPILDFNIRSQRYALRCGHREMARKEKEYFRHGRWVDLIEYVVFDTEWDPYWAAYQIDPDWFLRRPLDGPLTRAEAGER